MNGYIIVEMYDGIVIGISQVFLDEEIAKQKLKELSEVDRKHNLDTSFRIIERGVV